MLELFKIKFTSVTNWGNQTIVKDIYIVLILWQLDLMRSSRPEVFCIKVVLKISQNSQQNTCVRVSLLIKLQASGLCEFCEIFKNTIFKNTEHLRQTVSAYFVNISSVTMKYEFFYTKNWIIYLNELHYCIINDISYCGFLYNQFNIISFPSDNLLKVTNK